MFPQLPWGSPLSSSLFWKSVSCCFYVSGPLGHTHVPALQMSCLPQPCSSPSHPSRSSPLALRDGVSFMRLLGTMPETQRPKKNKFKKDSWAKEEGQAFLLSWNSVMGITSLCGGRAHTHSLNGISIPGTESDQEETEHLLCPMLAAAASLWPELIIMDSN